MSYNALDDPDPKKWLTLDQSDRAEQVVEYHRSLGPPHATIANLRLHAAIHVIVETQLALGFFAETGATLLRLMNEGLDRHEAVHAIGSVVAELFWNGDSLEPGEKQRARLKELDALSAERWRRRLE